MANSSVLGWVGGGQTVQAWCLTGFYTNGLSMGQMTLNNFINGYNLLFDDAAYSVAANTTQQQYTTGAIPFRFVSPMPDTKYKIFVHSRTVGTDSYYDTRQEFCHALNNRQYPKTVNGFWVRFGVQHSTNAPFKASLDTMTVSKPYYGEIWNRSQANDYHQLQVVVL